MASKISKKGYYFKKKIDVSSNYWCKNLQYSKKYRNFAPIFYKRKF